MNIYTTTAFKGYWPVGTAATVTAETPERAAELLNEHLAEATCPTQDRPLTADDFEEVPADREWVRVLQDGDY